MADDQGVQKARVSLYCGIASILTIIALFLWTEFLFDSSIMLNKWYFPILLISLVPFVCMKLPESKKPNIIAILFTMLNFIVCGVLFYMRNKVNKIWIEDPNDAELINKLVAYLKPSGVIIFASPLGENLNTDIQSVVKDSALDLNGPTAEALKERMSKYSKTPIVKGDKIILGDEDLKNLRFSGIQNQLSIRADNITDKATAEGLGFKTLPK